MSDDNDNQDVNLSNDADDTNDTGGGEGENDTSADDDDGQGDGGQDDSSVQNTNLDDITDPDELREIAKKTQGQNSKLFARIQDSKGLKLDKKTGKWVPKQKPQQQQQKKNNAANEDKSDELTSQELYTLIEAKVPKEDINEVRDYARLKNISIEDALKSNVVQTILSERAEERTTADATNTGPSRKGSQKPSTQDIVRNAEEKGEIPEDQADVEALVDARIKKKIGNNK